MSYANFKSLIAARALPWFYRELPDKYEFRTYEGPLAFDCVIFKSAAAAGGFDAEAHAVYVSDFEDNHRAGAIDIS